MNTFTIPQKISLARSLISKSSPAYVQFYITSRCNLVCEQCNIIYADASSVEMNIQQIRSMANNLAEIGVCIVLLIGGEPFVRKDLSLIVEAFTSVGIHVRMQTNGLATREDLIACIEAGAHDISISLDSLDSFRQDIINGGFDNSWNRAIDTVAMVNELFPKNGTAFFNTVLMPRNLQDIPDVIKFAKVIGWGVSIVPVHTTSPIHPRGFRTFDNEKVMNFVPTQYPELLKMIEEIKNLKKSGYYVYDSDDYLDDMYRFVVGEPIRWRRRNDDVCDSPNLYFAIAPNGNMKVCCDFDLDESFPVYHPEFPSWYKGGEIHRNVEGYTRNCDGCMYGSYPEITISARFYTSMIERILYFNNSAPQLTNLTAEQMRNIAKEIYHSRISFGL